MGQEEADELTAQTAKSTSGEILRNFLKNEGRYFLLSTQSYSRSYAPKDNLSSNSYFTKYLISGLRGVKADIDDQGRRVLETSSVDDDGFVTPESLYRYVNYNIRREIPQQEPILKGSLSGDRIILAHYPNLAKMPFNHRAWRAEQSNTSPFLEGYDLKYPRAADFYPAHIKWTARPLLSTVEKLESIERRLFPRRDFGIDREVDKACLMIMQGELERALSIYDSIIQKDPNNLDAINGKGVVLDKMRKYERAIVCFDRVIDIDNQNVEAITNKASTLIRSGKNAEAETYFRKVIELPLHSSDTNTTISKGIALIALQRYREAIEEYRKILDSDPRNRRALINTGIAYMRIEEYEKAGDYYDRVLTINPCDVIALYDKACNYSLQHKTKEALATLERVFKIHSAFKGYALKDPEFYNIRDNPQFKKLTYESHRRKRKRVLR